jgi:hypothetical protein
LKEEGPILSKKNGIDKLENYLPGGLGSQ